MLQKSVQVNRKILATPSAQCTLYNVYYILLFILWLEEIENLNIKAKMFDFEARVPIGWLAGILARQPIKTRTSEFNILVLMLRWTTFLAASIA